MSIDEAGGSRLLVASEILDKAMVVAVNEGRTALAVWKGRGRIDVYDPSGTLHETTRPYPVEEEGRWPREEILRFATEALAGSSPVPSSTEPADAVSVDVGAVTRASLIRAWRLGYALWDGLKDVDVYAADGTRVGWVTVPFSDVPRLTLFMLDLLVLVQPAPPALDVLGRTGGAISTN